jgi:SAM-dependent methyltransferase
MNPLKGRPTRKRVVTDYFDDQSPIYFVEHYRKTDATYPVLYLRHQYILKMLGNVSNGKALDVGCGAGAMLLELHQRGWTAVGTDLSPAMIRNAGTLFAAHQTPKPLAAVADIEHLPYADNVFSVVICAGVIEYLERDDGVLKEIARVLQPQGVAFISVTNALTPLWFFETAGRLLGIWQKAVSLVKGVTFPKARVHIPSTVAKQASRFNLVEADRAYFHFTPVPFPLDRICPLLSRRAGLRMEKLSQTRWSFLGRGCVIKMVKKANTNRALTSRKSISLIRQIDA